MGVSGDVTSSGSMPVYFKSPMATTCSATQKQPKTSAPENEEKVWVPADKETKSSTVTSACKISDRVEHTFSICAIRELAVEKLKEEKVRKVISVANIR